MALERLAHPARAHRTSPEGDDAAVGVFQELADLLGLEATELLLASAAEEAGDRHPDLALQELVRLDRLDARGPRRVCGGRLARPHEAHEDQRWTSRGALARLGPGCAQRRHPMRLR